MNTGHSTSLNMKTMVSGSVDEVIAKLTSLKP